MKKAQTRPADRALKRQKKEDFGVFLKEYYAHTFVNTDAIFNSLNRANSHIKKKYSDKITLLDVTDVLVVKEIKEALLSNARFAFGAGLKKDDNIIVLLDRYADFLSKGQSQTSKEPPPSTPEKVKTSSITEDEQENAVEGMLKEVAFFRRKRNRAIRLQCAKNAGYKCYVCGMDFESVYGERGHEFIEVHHLKPLSSYDGEHEIDLSELCALCSNCHSMVHHGKDVLDVDVLKEIYERNKNN